MATTATDQTAKATKTATQDHEVDAGKEAALAAYNNLLEAGEHFRHAARAAGMNLKDEASEQWVKGRDKAVSVGQQANEYVHERPIAALGMAFVAGLMVAQMFNRR